MGSAPAEWLSCLIESGWALSPETGGLVYGPTVPGLLVGIPWWWWHLVGDRQVTDLDEVLDLSLGTDIRFIRLVQLAGG